MGCAKGQINTLICQYQKKQSNDSMHFDNLRKITRQFPKSALIGLNIIIDMFTGVTKLKKDNIETLTSGGSLGRLWVSE